LVLTYKHILARFKQLKEQENRRKFNKVLAAGEASSVSDDEDSDDESTEEVLFALLLCLNFFFVEFCKATRLTKSSFTQQPLRIQNSSRVSDVNLAIGRTCGGCIQYR
jgi:hypothetical protein